MLKGIFSLITFVKISDEKDIKTTVYLYIYSEREREKIMAMIIKIIVLFCGF